MFPGAFITENFQDRFPDFLRRLKVGISEAEIENLVGPQLVLQFDTLLEHFPDPGSSLHVIPNFHGDRHMAPYETFRVSFMTRRVISMSSGVPMVIRTPSL